MNRKYNNIEIKILKNVLNINLDRPEKKNALNPEMINDLQEVLNKYKKDKTIRVVLISSNCDVFCSGADIKYLHKMLHFNYQKNLKDSKILMCLFNTMLLYPKLIISKVCGAAIAGGCGIITASDIVFSSENSKYGYPEVKIGFTPALVSTLLINKVNTSHANKLLLTGEIINAQKALEIGLINYIYNENNIDSNIQQFIDTFIQNTAPTSIERTKKTIYINTDMEKKLKKAAEINAQSRRGNDFKKGITTFLKKEPINWGK